MVSDIINIRTVPQKQSKTISYGVGQCRVSDERQKQKNVSLPAQKSNIEKYAAEHNIVILKWEFIDHSGYRELEEDKRFTDLVNYAINESRVTYYLVDEKGRFARNRYERVVYEEKLRRANVKLVGVSEPDYDRKTVTGVWLDGIGIIKNEATSVEIAYHVMKGMNENAEMRDPETNWCYKNGGNAPDGYSNKRVVRGKDARGKDLIKLLWDIDPERSQIIRYIVLTCWLNKGLSYKKIRDHLNSAEPKWDSRRDRVPSAKGGLWSHTTIREICVRAMEGVYSGIYYWNRTGRDLRGTGVKWKNPNEWKMVKNAHPSIITLEEWDELKNIKKITNNKSRGPSKIESSRWMFTGFNAIGELMFECINCNSSMSSGQSKRIYNYYICSGNANQGEAKCNAKCFVPKEWLEDNVVNSIKKRFNPKYINNLVEAINSSIDEEDSDRLMAIKHLEKALLEKDRAIQNIINALTKLENPRAIDTLTKQLESIEQEKLDLENDLAQFNIDKPDVKIDRKTILHLIDKLDIIMQEGSNKEKREIVRRFVRRLELDPTEGVISVIFWPDPFGQERERLILIKKDTPGVSEEVPGSNEMGLRPVSGTSKTEGFQGVQIPGSFFSRRGLNF